MQLNEQSDLRGGRVCWQEGARTLALNVAPARADVLIVGAGVMGAMVAEQLTSRGRSVAVIDRRSPVEGATAASTALVMWAADVPLSHLARRIGLDTASERWRHVSASVGRLDELVSHLKLECGWASRPEVYLCGGLLDEAAIAAEGAMRQHAGLPSVYRDAAAIAERFGIAPRAGLVSGGSFEVDPVALAFGLLEAAQHHGATVSAPLELARFEAHAEGVRAVFADGSDMLAQHIVLATGYEPARLFLPAAFKLSSSYAIASAPGVAPVWREQALIWQAAEPYLYARSTADGRIIVGGEDEDFVDAEKRDALIGNKSGALQAKARAYLTDEPIKYECAWASTFGSSPDGLPAIGRARNAENVWLAYGYGGNGVTFAALAAGLLDLALQGRAGEPAKWFDPYRFEAEAR